MKLRVFRLGSLEHKVFPSDKAYQKLADSIMNGLNDEELCLIWGPDLQVEEYEVGPDDQFIVTDETTKIEIYDKSKILKVT